MRETVTMTLSDFLLARIAEDEGVAKNGASEAAWWPWGSPARVLAECEAKRRIVENCERASEAALNEPMSERLRSVDPPVRAYWRGQDWACKVLALPYADHPDYRGEWRP